MATEVVSMRVKEGVKAHLERFSRSLGRKAADTGAMLLEEGLRQAEHPYIEFRSSRLGRQAYLKNTRLAVWFIHKVAAEYQFSVEKTGQHFDLTETKIKAALHYAASYASEIELAIADSAANEEAALKGLFPTLETVEI